MLLCYVCKNIQITAYMKHKYLLILSAENATANEFQYLNNEAKTKNKQTNKNIHLKVEALFLWSLQKI